MHPRSRARTRLARKLSWLAVASLTSAALLAPSASPVRAGVVVTDPGSGNPDCAALGYSLEFKIDTGDLENRTYVWNEGGVVKGDWTGQSITISGLSANGQVFDWASTLPVSAVLVKAGNANHALYTYAPPATSGQDLTKGPNQQGISHVTFCGDPVVPTPARPDAQRPAFAAAAAQQDDEEYNALSAPFPAPMWRTTGQQLDADIEEIDASLRWNVSPARLLDSPRVEALAPGPRATPGRVTCKGRSISFRRTWKN